MRRLAVALVTSLFLLAPKTAFGQSSSALTNADVLRLVAAGVPDQTTIAAIEQAQYRQFDITTLGIAEMKHAGVSDAVIGAMQRVSPPPPDPPPAIVGQASSLVGLTQDQLLEKIGTPSGTQNGVWYFDSSPAGTLRVYITNGLVTEVHPDDFSLSSLTRRAPPRSQPRTTNSPSAGIVCRDGTVSGAANRRGACSSHGGIR